MASTYTPLGVEKMATGENAGTWGTKTNTNLEIIEQFTGGYTTQAVSDSGDTTLSVSDGSTGATLAHRVIEFTGSLAEGIRKTGGTKHWREEFGYKEIKKAKNYWQKESKMKLDLNSFLIIILVG